MMFIKELLTAKGLGFFLILKIAALIAILFLNRTIYFGDKPVTAAQQEKTDRGQKIAQARDDQMDDEDIATTRKSFLEDLLHLPKLDTTKLKKAEIGRYLGIIERKRTQVEDRLRLLRKREKHLKNLESVLDTKLAKLEEEMVYFQQTIQKEKKIKAKRLKELIDFYAKMTPKKAAPIFETLDRDLVVALFNGMPKKKQVTAILSLMNPQRSVELSEYYGRIRSASEYELLKEINFALRKQFDACKGMPETPDNE